LHPTYSSWLKLVERFIAELTSTWLGRGTHRSARVRACDPGWIETWNQHPRPFVWTKTADQILDTIATYCQRISNSGHELMPATSWNAQSVENGGGRLSRLRCLG
jgi:hypothetical protein